MLQSVNWRELLEWQNPPSDAYGSGYISRKYVLQYLVVDKGWKRGDILL